MEASWKSPIVFVIENNLWAIWNLDVTSATSIPQEWKNRPAFGMPGIQVDRIHVLKFREAGNDA